MVENLFKFWFTGDAPRDSYGTHRSHSVWDTYTYTENLFSLEIGREI